MMNCKRFWDSPFWARYKDHYCLNCQNKLQLKKTTKIIDSNSEEAKEFDLSFPGMGGYLIGKIKVIYDEFECPQCNANYSIDLLRKHEREQKRLKRKLKKKVD